MRIGGRDFDTENGVYIMGILNLTPDSFSDGGRWTERDAALRQAARMASEGAAIIDLGGESTRPGHTPVGAAEEAGLAACTACALGSGARRLRGFHSRCCSAL